MHIICIKCTLYYFYYLSIFVFSVGSVIGPLVRFDSGVLQDSGQPVESRPFLDVSFDAVIAFGRLRTGG